MIVPFKFVAGFVANALVQPIRCSANVLICVASAFVSVLMLALAFLQFFGGGFDQGKKTLSHSWFYAKNSFKSGSFATVQVLGLATLASPFIRAAQACSEPVSPEGIFVPCGRNRNLLQCSLGLNSWNSQKEVQSVKPENKNAPLVLKTVDENKITEQKPSNVKTYSKKNSSKKTSSKETSVKKKRKKAEENKSKNWDSLVTQYLEAKTANEMDVLRSRMALKHPAEYLRALNIAKKPGSKKNAA